MKKPLHFFGILSMIMLLNLMSNAQIVSISGSGLWHDPSSWIGGVVPGAGDDVVINGNIYVTSYQYCYNLSINPGDTLSCGTYTNGTLQVGGSIYNQGAIIDIGFANLDLRVSGNINNQEYWANNSTQFEGTSTQYITLQNGEIFTNTTFNVLNPSGIQLATDLVFLGTIDLNDLTLNLDHHDITFISGSVVRTGTMTNPSEFKGKMHIYTYLNVVGDVTVTDTVRNINNNNAWFNIYGSLENNGAILTNTYSNYRLSASITGDILHNGIWHTEYTNLNGTSEQFITCQPGKYFQTSMVDNNPDTIRANSDFNLLGIIDLNDHVMDMNNYTIHCMEPGAQLYRGTVINVGDIDGPVYLNGEVNIYGDIDFEDFVTVRYSANIYGNVTVSDTVRNIYNSDGWFNIHGSLENNGVILTNTYSNYRLSASVTGDIIHKGVWNTESTHLNGTSGQYISLSSGKMFQTEF